MSMVPTTAGDIDATELGRVMTHEHLRGSAEGVRVQWPHAFDPAEEERAIIAEIEKVAARGVETICDPSCMDLGRDVQLNIAVTEATGVRFVMCTGVYGVGYSYLPLFLQRDPGVLVDYFVHDIEVGIQNTPIRAGFLKCAADHPGMTPDIIAIHEATAEASLRTNTPIMAHSNPVLGGSAGKGVGLDQMALFTAKGVDPGMVQIAHVGDTDDLDYIEALLDTGCYIGLDRYGIGAGRLGTEERNATLLALLERGYRDRMMLGHDAVIRMDGWAPGQRAEERPDWHPTYIFEHVLPVLASRGASEEDLDAMFGVNVRSWLSA